MTRTVESVLDSARALANSQARQKGVQWGFSKSQLPPINPATGVQFVNEYNCGEFAGSGEPQSYEVRIGVLWSPTALPLGLPNAGMLQALISYGVGGATFSVTIDVGVGASIIVPGGNISVKVIQTAPYVFAAQALSVSISKYPSGRLTLPTTTVSAIGTPFVGPFAMLEYRGRVPYRAKRVRLNAVFARGLYRLVLQTDSVNAIAILDSGSDRYALQAGVPIPPNALFWLLQGPNVALDFPSLTYELE